MVIIGKNFANCTGLKICFDNSITVDPTFYESGTLVCNAPVLPRTEDGKVTVKVSNNGLEYSESSFIINYKVLLSSSSSSSSSLSNNTNNNNNNNVNVNINGNVNNNNNEQKL